VRERVSDRIVLSSYGRATGFCVDPIEKKPLYHFLPGSSVLSFGTAGCNLGCRFCQNWSTSKARAVESMSAAATPETIAEAAVREGSRSVAFTYNDPVIFAEFAIDTALACHEHGVRTVAVTAGYIEPGAREEFFSHIDAANVDLKSFRPEFYRKLCYAELEPVLDTLRYLHHQTNVWLEITTLLIPGENDSEAEIDALSEFVARELGPEVPLHFSAFHPDFELTDLPRTPAATCQRAREQALSHGLMHVYTGNIHDPRGQTTTCASCGKDLIVRSGYRTSVVGLAGSACRHCGHPLAGRF
jgi:pyruvate formate lyase activating enzyme